MKTFKLVHLKIINGEENGLVHTRIPLYDGLIINREDAKNRWVIEAYTSKIYLDYFQELQNQDKIMIQVKITKKSNDPAVFLTSIIDINEIGTKMNVLFMGTIVDQRKDRIESILKELINKGYEGKELLKQFKHHYKTE